MNEKELYTCLRREENQFEVYDLGCGMLAYEEVIAGYWRTRYLLNTRTEKAYEIVGRDLKLKSFSINDVEIHDIDKFEYADNAYRLAAYYPFSIYKFENGIAYVNWTLHPDGEYFMDEDGFGMEACDEESIGAYINPDGKVLIKFQEMTDKSRLQMYNKALELMCR